MEAITKAGYVPGKQIFLGMDVASSEFYDPETKLYTLKKSGQGTKTSAESRNDRENLRRVDASVAISQRRREALC